MLYKNSKDQYHSERACYLANEIEINLSRAGEEKSWTFTAIVITNATGDFWLKQDLESELCNNNAGDKRNLGAILRVERVRKFESWFSEPQSQLPNSLVIIQYIQWGSWVSPAGHNATLPEV